jgi:hypothetical protein
VHTVPISHILRVVLAATVLVGCAAQISYSTAHVVPIASASAPVIPSPSPTPVELTQAEQGRLYLASVHVFNRRLCSFDTRWAGRTEWEARARAIDKLANSYRRWADVLRDIAWTGPAKDDVSDLVRNLAAQEAAMRSQAAASDKTSFWHIDRMVERLTVKVVEMDNAVRGSLGTVSVGGDPCESDGVDDPV